MPPPRLGSFTPTVRYRYFSGAECIWKRELVHAYNCHLIFRKRFDCDSPIFAGELRITASDTYRLFINGQFVGDGPTRSERGQAYVDHYNAVDLPISPGENVIVVIALNKYLAEHGQPPKDGAIALALDAHCSSGCALELRTGKDWKVRIADWYRKPAPRRFSPIGFNEHIDFRKAGQDVLNLRFPDTHWESADVVDDKHLAQCYPRPTPPFIYNHIFPKAALRWGKTGSLTGMMGVARHKAELPAASQGRFKTWVYAESNINDAYVFFGCDNHARVIVNGESVWEQGAPDNQFRQHLSTYEDAWYQGMFHGHGIRFEPNAADRVTSRCQLKAGWNELVVDIDFFDKCYGFELTFCDTNSNQRLPLLNRAQQAIDENNTWLWRVADTDDWQLLKNTSEEIRPYLEPSHLTEWDYREKTEIPEGVDTVFRRAEDGGLVLLPGQFVEYELEAYAVGFLKMNLSGPEGSIVEFALSERNDLTSDRISPINNGQWLVERITLSGNEDQYTGLERRGGRYLSIHVRKARGPVIITTLMMRAMRYNNERMGEFTCSDPVLNWMWKIGYRTTELSTFDLSENCPTREMAQSSGDTFVRTHQLACMWGDLRVSEKAIREFAADQLDNRWGRAMVPSGYGDSIVDFALLLPIWIWSHYQITGGEALIPDVFSGVRNLFTYASKFEDKRGYLIPMERSRNQVYLDMKLADAVRQLPNVAGLQAYYVKSLEHGALLADMLGQKPMAHQWRAKAKNLRTRINEDFWAVNQALYMNGEDGNGRICPETGAATNYIMLWADIPPADRATAMLKQLFPAADEENLNLWPDGEGVYLKHLMADALLKRGCCYEALTAWRGFYGSMMNQMKTIPEAWDRSWADKLPTEYSSTPSANFSTVSPASSRSLVHPVGIGAMWHLMTHICGIKPAKPGYREIHWEPMPGDLQTMNARFPLVNREEYVEISIEPNAQGGRCITLSCPTDIAVESSNRWLASNDYLGIQRNA
ncbi:hypothetical protein GCM10007047_14140 [Cerasicoccus arenae]|uniref:Alpha-L-rhamnosidase six-hairpin glycosidase domain-containing protein n=2 Tax=Cerasicoccus arenae TaxID=424488 RepID=A0A8J3D9P3_9BACT|nr:hypothetical protein GCM10007047_14140 [Cerasicoccus arenae]